MQDLRVHHTEILGKFVAIMRERLAVSLKQLPAAAALWQDDSLAHDLQPSTFAYTLIKQLRILSQVLDHGPIMPHNPMHLHALGCPAGLC